MHGGPGQVWHPETITAGAERTLIALRGAGLLGNAYLAGGTGLALHFGHRRSLDLDFFVQELFDEEALLQSIQVIPGFSLVATGPHTLHITVDETKVSFLGYTYPLLFPPALFLDVPVADPRDIACMKIVQSPAAALSEISSICTPHAGDQVAYFTGPVRS